jgi:hypothetical protein
MAALSPKIWALGFAVLLATMLVYPTPITILVLVFGGVETYRRWKQRKDPGARRYYQVKPGTRVAIGLTYIGLAAALGVGMHFTHLERSL